MKKIFTTFLVLVFAFVIAMIAITQREALVGTLTASWLNYLNEFFLFLAGILTSIILMIITVLYLKFYLGMNIRVMKIREEQEE